MTHRWPAAFPAAPVCLQKHRWVNSFLDTWFPSYPHKMTDCRTLQHHHQWRLPSHAAVSPGCPGLRLVSASGFLLQGQMLPLLCYSVWKRKGIKVGTIWLQRPEASGKPQENERILFHKNQAKKKKNHVNNIKYPDDWVAWRCTFK